MDNGVELVQLFAAIRDRNWRAVENWATAHGLDEHDAARRVAERYTGTDSLTGLANLAGYRLRAEAMLQTAHREQKQLHVAVLDLDGLKQVNDKQGHHAGDMLIIEFAELLKSLVRPSDAVARIGGDEFLVLTTSDCSNRLRRASAEYASCGNAAVEVCEGDWDLWSAQQLLEYATSLADEAMYKDKRKRKGT